MKYFGENGKYVVDNIHIFCINGELTPYGIINPTRYCNYYFRYDMMELGPYCPTGYTYEGSNLSLHNACRSNNKHMAKINLKCPDGYYQKDQYTCIKNLTTAVIINYSCNEGYKLIDNMCLRTYYMQPELIYECPEGYKLNFDEHLCEKG